MNPVNCCLSALILGSAAFIIPAVGGDGTPGKKKKKEQIEEIVRKVCVWVIPARISVRGKRTKLYTPCHLEITSSFAWRRERGRRMAQWRAAEGEESAGETEGWARRGEGDGERLRCST